MAGTQNPLLKKFALYPFYKIFGSPQAGISK